MAKGKIGIPPVFIISLDFELLWGHVAYSEAEAVSLMNNDARKGRGATDCLLGLFERYNIPATWATVGHLFLDHCVKKDGLPHPEMPRFNKGWYSWDPCTDLSRDPLYYAKDVVEKIMASKAGHEIGYHSFSHVNFSECSPEVAEAELKAGQELAQQLGITFKSLVFPENAIGHVDLLKKYGYQIYRGKYLRRYHPDQNRLLRYVNGAIDRYAAPTTEPLWRDGIWEIPSSLFFFDRRFAPTLLFRARRGIDSAIRSKRVFHVYLHPYNLLMDASLPHKLEELLSYVARKRDQGKLRVLTMGQLAELLG